MTTTRPPTTGATAGHSEEATDVTTADGEPIYPFSWADGEAAGLTDELEWGERCDTERGTAGDPGRAAPAVLPPVRGRQRRRHRRGRHRRHHQDRRATSPPEADPIIKYITDAVAVDDTNAEQMDTQTKQVALLQTYCETYGRTVEVEYYVSQGGATDATTARADAVKIAEDIKPFMVWGGPILTDAFGEELAARGISCICVCRRQPGGAGGVGAVRHRPRPHHEQARAHNVEVLAKQVAGRNAEYAGDPEFQEQERMFALPPHRDRRPRVGRGRAERRSTPRRSRRGDRREHPVRPRPGHAPGDGRQRHRPDEGGRRDHGDLRRRPGGASGVHAEATKQEYFPEWFLNISALVDTNVFARTYDQEQWQHAFGLTALAARVDNENAGARFVYEWFYGELPQADGYVEVIAPQPALFFAVAPGGRARTSPASRSPTRCSGSSRSPDRLTASSLSWGQHDRWPDIDG